MLPHWVWLLLFISSCFRKSIAIYSSRSGIVGEYLKLGIREPKFNRPNEGLKEPLAFPKKI